MVKIVQKMANTHCLILKLCMWSHFWKFVKLNHLERGGHFTPLWQLFSKNAPYQKNIKNGLFGTWISSYNKYPTLNTQMFFSKYIFSWWGHKMTFFTNLQVFHPKCKNVNIFIKKKTMVHNISKHQTFQIKLYFLN